MGSLYYAKNVTIHAWLSQYNRGTFWRGGVFQAMSHLFVFITRKGFFNYYRLGSLGPVYSFDKISYFAFISPFSYCDISYMNNLPVKREYLPASWPSGGAISPFSTSYTSMITAEWLLDKILNSSRVWNETVQSSIGSLNRKDKERGLSNSVWLKSQLRVFHRLAHTEIINYRISSSRE